MSDKVRVDKWLWAIRIFKSRTISTDTCKSGKVKCKDEVLKPSSLVSIGNIVEVRKNGFQFLFKVLKPITKRVSASEAVLCYANLTSEEELNKFINFSAFLFCRPTFTSFPPLRTTFAPLTPKWSVNPSDLVKVKTIINF